MNTIDYTNKSKAELLDIIQRLSDNLSQKDSQLLYVTTLNSNHESKISYLSRQITFFEEYIRALKLRQFAAKSEKNISYHQLSFFDEAIPPKEPEKILNQEVEIQVNSHVRKKTGRKPLPNDLPRVERIYDLTDQEKICACGSQLTHITNEQSEQLEIIPAKLYVIRHIKKKYACRSCEDTIKTAVMPKPPIPKSIAASGLLSHILVSKFKDHLPLHRQEKIFKRVGIDIPRASLSLWVIKCAELLSPLMKMIHRIILNYDIAYSDETTVQVLKEPTKTVNSTKYMWVFAGGPPDKFCFYYKYNPSRSHEIPFEFFGDFKGYLHCDGFSAYDALVNKKPDIILLGCMYHVRRKFVEIVKITKATTGVATDVIYFIRELSKIEEDIKLLTNEEKYIIRQEKSKPILDKLHSYLIAVKPTILPKSMLGHAVDYTLNQWPKLINYLHDARAENNNNRTERAIKPFAIGRKGWLFADSVAGANAAAIIFSLIETCSQHNIEPYNWLRHVLQNIQSCTTEEELEKLLPFNINPELLIPIPS